MCHILAEFREREMLCHYLFYELEFPLQKCLLLKPRLKMLKLRLKCLEPLELGSTCPAMVEYLASWWFKKNKSPVLSSMFCLHIFQNSCAGAWNFLHPERSSGNLNYYNSLKITVQSSRVFMHELLLNNTIIYKINELNIKFYMCFNPNKFFDQPHNF